MRLNDIRWIGFAVGVGLVLSIHPAAARMDVKVEFDKTFDFKTIRTWGWRPSGPGDVKMARTQQDDPESMRRQAEPILVDAVAMQIARRGLQPATADPDLIVTYYLLLTTSMSAQTLGQFLPATTGWGLPPFEQATQSLKMMNRGSLVLDLSAKGNVVWRGVAQANIKFDADSKKRESLLQEAVRDLLAKYPAKELMQRSNGGGIAPMTWRGRLGTAVMMLCSVPALCSGQDLTPRAYLITPVSANAVGLTYALSKGEITFDPTLPVTDASGTVHTPVLTYYYAFGLLGRSANVTGALPWANGHFQASVAGVSREAHRQGLLDSTFRFAVNWIGGPALPAAEFVKTPPSKYILGTSVRIVAPTGQYVSTRAINPGNNRWAFKPEIGFSRRGKRLIVDGYVGVWVFTTNDDYVAPSPDVQGSERKQSPIGSFEGHVSYDVHRRLWLSFDVNYWYGGRTTVDGVRSLTSLQANSRLGLTGAVPLNRHQSVKASFSNGVITRVGGSFKILSVGWQYSWLGLPFRGTQ